MADDKNFSLVNLGGAAGDIVKELFGPSARNMGKVFGAVTGLVYSYFRKYEYYNAIEDEIMIKNLREFKEELDKIPEEKILTAPPEISHQIFTRFEYVSNEELSKAFQTLLLRASNIDTVSTAHPGFIQIIDRLSSDEAKILNFLKTQFTAKVIFEKTTLSIELPENAISIEKNISFVISDLFADAWFTEIDLRLKDELILKEEKTLYYENLTSLGLITYKSHSNIENIPSIKFTNYTYKDLIDNYKSRVSLDDEKEENDTINIEYVKGEIMLTNFGHLFMKCCFSNN